MFKITKLTRDPDAWFALAVALAALLTIAFLPDPAWDRLIERGRFLIAALTAPTAVVVLRYVLRITGAAQTGRVLSSASYGEVDAANVITLVEHGTSPAPGASVGDVLTDADLDELDRAASEAG